MKQIYLRKFLTIVTALIITNTFAQTSTDGLWNKLSSTEVDGDKVRRSSFPTSYYLFQLNLNALRAQ